MAEPKKNKHPLVVKGTFFVTASYEDKQYVVSNGLSFIRFVKEGEDIKKGDYVNIHGPVYQKKGSANPIITGEAIVTKLTEEEVTAYKADTSKAVAAAKKDTAKKSTAKKTEKTSENKMPWE